MIEESAIEFLENWMTEDLTNTSGADDERARRVIRDLIRHKQYYNPVREPEPEPVPTAFAEWFAKTHPESLASITLTFK